MNPGYNDENLQRIKDNAKLLDLDRYEKKFSKENFVKIKKLFNERI